MTEYNFGDVIAKATKAFGSTPNANTEQRLLDIFKTAPAHVNDTVDNIIQGHKAGRIHSPWGFLLKAVENPTTPTDLTVTDTTERDTAIRKAEHWARHTGIHYDRQTEIEDDLFGNHGKLRLWANDTDLRTHMANQWKQHRPRGEQAEQDHDAYMQHFREQQARLPTTNNPNPNTPTE